MALFPLLMTLFLALLPSAAPTLHIDLVLITHDYAQYFESSDFGYRAVYERILGDEFPRLFSMGDQRTRAAIVSTSRIENGYFDYRVTTSMTGDESIWKRGLVNLPKQPNAINDAVDVRKRSVSLARALQIVRENVTWRSEDVGFVKPRVVLISSFSDPSDNRFRGADVEIENLRRARVHVWVVWRRVVHEVDNGKLRAKFLSIVGNRREDAYELPRGHGFEQAFADLLDWMDKKIDEKYCHWDPLPLGCFYSDADRHECKMGEYTSSIPLSRGECRRRPQSQLHPVECPTKEDCETTCDHLWPWLVSPPMDCAGLCGPFEGVRRNGSMPWRQLEHCVTEFECPECPTTMTTDEAMLTSSGAVQTSENAEKVNTDHSTQWTTTDSAEVIAAHQTSQTVTDTTTSEAPKSAIDNPALLEAMADGAAIHKMTVDTAIDEIEKDSADDQDQPEKDSEASHDESEHEEIKFEPENATTSIGSTTSAHSGGSESIATKYVDLMVAFMIACFQAIA